jgi:hypothetical protein
MHETQGHIEATEGGAAFSTRRIPMRRGAWSMTDETEPHKGLS